MRVVASLLDRAFKEVLSVSAKTAFESQEALVFLLIITFTKSDIINHNIDYKHGS